MSVPLGKRGKDRWPEPDKWQVILTAASLEGTRIGAIVAFRRQDRHRSWRSWSCDAL